MSTMTSSKPSAERVSDALEHFVRWVDAFGEDSWDHQSFFAGPIGGRAKQIYYRQPGLGLLAVAPMILCEDLLPSARRFFHKRIRFPIADAPGSPVTGVRSLRTPLFP